MYLYDHKTPLINNVTFNAILLVILFLFFASSYITSVISPQFGWWHYYAWRMGEGDVLYKDIYLFMSPYFVFLTKLFYCIFDNHLFLYTIFIGFPVKIGCILMMYNIMLRVTLPFYACMSVFCGACLSVTYNMDMWYDFNPILMLPCLIVALLYMKYYEKLKTGIVSINLSFWIGILVSLILCLKQTFGLTFLFAIILMSYILYKREYCGSFIDFMRSIVSFMFGFFLSLLPGILYMTYYNCWSEFMQCIISVGDAKGGIVNILLRCFFVLSTFKIWVYIAFIYSVWYLYKRRNANGESCNNMLENKRFIVLILLFVIAIMLYISLPVNFHSAVSNNLFLMKWRSSFYHILTYSGILVWAYWVISYLAGKKELSPITVFGTIIIVHFFTGVLSTDFLEEIYLLLYVPWILAISFKNCINYNKIIRTVLLIIVFFSFTCISTKINIPYSWQGWTTPPVQKSNIFSTVKGLEGHTMPRDVNTHFTNIVNIINKYCEKKDDKVFQFSNIPLFNLLTNKEIPTYAPITWFDVCPDKIAQLVAEQLYANNPKVIVWNNMNEDNWNIVEHVFRGGKRSGQREILGFYNNVVKKEYKKVYFLNNNRDGIIEIWVKE